MYEISNIELGISSAQGSLVIKLPDQKPIILKRPSLRVYEQFYDAWQAALISTRQEPGDFISLWCSNNQFRTLITKALKYVGIEDPSVFSGPQLVALLMHYEGKQGILFQFNETVPKFPEQSPQTNVFGTTLPLQVLLTQLSKLPTQNWMEKRLYKLGLFLISSSIMRLNNSHQLHLTLSEQKIICLEYSKKTPKKTP